MSEESKAVVGKLYRLLDNGDMGWNENGYRS